MKIQVLNNSVKINIIYKRSKEAEGTYDDSKTQINIYVNTKKENKEALKKVGKIYHEEKYFKGILLHELTHALFVGNWRFDSLIQEETQHEIYKDANKEGILQEQIAYHMEYAPYLIHLRDELYKMIVKQIKKDCKE